MNNGMELQELKERAFEIAQTKKDYIIPDGKTEIVLENGRFFVDLIPDANVFNPQPIRLSPTKYALKQLAQKYSIGTEYADLLAVQQPELLEENFQKRKKFFAEKDKGGFYRAVGSQLRSLHSPSYFPFDAEDFLPVVTQFAEEFNMDVKSCYIDEDKMYMKMVFPDSMFDISPDPQVNDFLGAGICLSTNGRGQGGFSLEPFLYRLKCANGMVVSEFTEDVLKKNHRGIDKWSDGLVVYNVDDFYKESRKKRSLCWEISEVLKDSLKNKNLEKIQKKIRESQEIKIQPKNSAEYFEKIQKELKLTKEEVEMVQDSFYRENDLTVWGLANAITYTAGKKESYERSTELETIGGSVMMGRRNVAA